MSNQPPVLDPDKFKEQLRSKADARRAEIIKRMNDQRPAPKRTLEHTPTGSVVKEVHTPEAARKNAEINQQIQAYKQGIKRNQGKAREHFDRSRGR